MAVLAAEPLSRRRALIRVHRLEYPFPVAYLCHALWGVGYAAAGAAGLLSAPVLLTVAANLIALIAQNPLNAALDIRSDALTPAKRGVSAAAARLGGAGLLCAGAEMGTALALGAVVAVRYDRPVVALALAARIGLDLLYNLEPVRLKRRGYANPVALGLCFGTLPCVVSYAALRDDWPPAVRGLFLGIGVLMTGRALYWALPDRAADAASGDRTPAATHGTRHALRVVCGTSAAAITLITWAVAELYGPLWALAAAAVCAVLPADALRRLGRPHGAGAAPTADSLRVHAMTWAVLADAVLVALPFMAG
ncbi:UbiA family prenyltransferase [Streptomyces sp. NPDC088350]|uniref:UbiA family prenyltransferase n=1 Tax=Streptomyces sp. NPDC088350 TaxID=3365854 RepID=UPI0038160D53